jgi:hypothetical protein
MKKILFLNLALLVFPGGNIAQEITMEMARKTAINFIYEKTNIYKGTAEYNTFGIAESYSKKDDDLTLYYIFNMQPSGYVIVSGSQVLYPVLGYDYVAGFETENQPPSLEYWMGHYADQVRFAKENNLKPQQHILDAWDHYLGDDFKLLSYPEKGDQVEPLLTSVWHQNWPYNLYCPEDPAGPGGHAYAGCMATAYSQLLYYWRYPLHGTGNYCYTPWQHPEYGEQCADFENTWYRWDEMCDYPLTINTAIAELLYQAGVALEMEFSIGGSSARNLPEYFEAYFNISKDCEILPRECYTDTEWKNIIMDQLDQKLPTGYSGSDATSGHLWNCDGYQDTMYFHMNWGWGGSYNGYYTLDNLLGWNDYNFLIANFYPAEGSGYPYYASGPDTLKLPEGSITDGSGPLNNYQDNTFASWLIDPQNETDSVTNISLSIKNCDLGMNDHLVFYDGKDNTAPVLYDLTSGSAIPTEILTTGNKAFVEFTSDGSQTGEGFHLNYFCNQPEWCNFLQTLTDSTAWVSDGSGNFYYDNNSVCFWQIEPDGCDTSLTLHFMYFETEETNDFLQIYDSESNELLATYSGIYEEPPAPVTSPSGKMMLVFKTNNNIRFDGFLAWYGSIVGIEEHEDISSVVLSPNPVTDLLHITCRLNTATYMLIEVYDLLGKQVHIVSDGQQPPGVFHCNFNMNELSPGVYLIHLKTANQIISRKIIKL